MEDVFSARMKAIFDFLISPDCALLRAVVIPRTSEQEHKLYLYLREVVRQGRNARPKSILYNLLHARSPEAEAYGLERTARIKDHAGATDRRRIEPEALSAAIAEGNAARQRNPRIVRAEGRSALQGCRGSRSAGADRSVVLHGSHRICVAGAGSAP